MMMIYIMMLMMVVKMTMKRMIYVADVDPLDTTDQISKGSAILNMTFLQEIS